MNDGSTTPDIQRPLRFEEICRGQIDRITAIRSVGGDYRNAVTALGDLLEPFILKSEKWSKEWDARDIHFRVSGGTKIYEPTLTDVRQWFSILLRFMEAKGWLKKTYSESWVDEDES